MALFGQKGEDVGALIAKKNYAKAIEVIKAQLRTQSHDPRLRMQLADVLISAGKGKEAIMILLPLADEYAKEGFAAKAISVLKKIQKIDPARRDVDQKLAALIQEKQQFATVSLPQAPKGFELGMEEIGFEGPSSGAISVPVEDARDPGPSLDIGMDAGPEISFGSPEPAPPPPPSRPAPKAAPPPPPPPPPPPRPAPVVDRDLEGFALPDEEPALALEPEPAAVEPEPELLPELEPEVSVEPELSVEPEVQPEEVVENPMSDTAFADELLSAIEGAFPTGMEGFAAAAAVEEPAQASGGGAQIVVSPLFKDFSVDEMVAVIQGLNLLTFEAGDIVMTQGDPGDSLYMLASGTVKAFVKNAKGRQVQVGELNEGAFFGELSILTGKPRSATIIASTRCELLELDRPTLDSITQTHSHVMDVLKEFAKQRVAKA